MTPTPGVTTTPTDQHFRIASRLVGEVRGEQQTEPTPVEMLTVRAIAQALAEQAAAIHARYEATMVRFDHGAELMGNPSNDYGRGWRDGVESLVEQLREVQQ